MLQTLARVQRVYLKFFDEIGSPAPIVSLLVRKSEALGLKVTLEPAAT